MWLDLELPVFGLRLVGGESGGGNGGGGGARQGAKISKIGAKTLQKCYFLWIWLPPDIGARLDPDWIPTGQKRCPKMQKLVPRLGPDGILTGSIDRQEPTPAPIFPFPDPPLPLFSFSRAPAVHQYPPLLHQNGKSSLKPNGGSTS